MDNTHNTATTPPATGTPGAPDDVEAPLLARSSPPPRRLEIRFTGSGSEYFRIWAVNLLLILLSAGLYLPFAKMRRIRYLYANTLIDGEALAFHGDANKMFRGFVLLAVLTLIYTFAGSFSPAAALPAFVLLCVVWPALWRASMQFRMGNTSWRGLRLGFEGSMRGAYLGFLPIYLPAAVLTALEPYVSGPSKDPGINGQWGFLLALGLLGLLAPWSTSLLKRYQHQGYRIASERGDLQVATRAVYAIGAKTVGMAVVMLFVTIMGTVVIGAVLSLGHSGKIDGQGNGSYFGIAFVGLIYLLGGSVVLTYYAARVQNLVWGNTRSEALQFRSNLTGLTVLTLKNWVLVVLTAGLYRPFAVIATARLRLESVWIETTSDPDTWSATPSLRPTDASGEVAGDFFGMDLGL
ncbi:YjgN family protein [Roseateles sp.]|uniref:YjgN family protein n=1 Tax=Roseateles sp. TaxID=1971397 RepID=UPI003925F643